MFGQQAPLVSFGVWDSRNWLTVKPQGLATVGYCTCKLCFFKYAYFLGVS